MTSHLIPYPILYLHHTGQFSGAENSLLHLTVNLKREKFTPIFLCPDRGEFPRRLSASGIRVFPHNFGRVRNLLNIINSMRKIFFIARRYGVKLLHSNGPQTNLPAGLVGRILGIPVVWHARNLLKPGMIDIDRKTGFLPHKIICNSEAIKMRFMVPRIEQKAIKIVNSVDLADYDLTISSSRIREMFGIPPDALVVGMTSRLGSDKGHLTLLKAVAMLKDQYPNIWVLIVGDNVFEIDAWVPEFLKNEAKELGIADRVIFAGFRRDVPQLYAGMDIFVLGTDAEPCGRVIFEAMAMAKPVVGTNNGGTAEIVVDGETGYLYRYGKPQELAAKLESLFSNPQLISRMGRKGRKRVEENFTIEKYVEKTQKEYLKLIGENFANRH